jgi:hypothetical protein
MAVRQIDRFQAAQLNGLGEGAADVMYQAILDRHPALANAVAGAAELEGRPGAEAVEQMAANAAAGMPADGTPSGNRLEDGNNPQDPVVQQRPGFVDRLGGRAGRHWEELQAAPLRTTWESPLMGGGRAIGRKFGLGPQGAQAVEHILGGSVAGVGTMTALSALHNLMAGQTQDTLPLQQNIY